MNLSVHGHNVEVNEVIRDYVERKIGRLDRYLPGLDEARVDIREQNTRNADQRYVVQVTLYDHHGTIIRGEERATEIFPAVDNVADKLHNQIMRFKGKQRDRYQRSAAQEEWMEARADLDGEGEDDNTAIVRTKRFAMSPMSAEEAIDQMELLGHTFFVFYDVDAGGANVVYRRRDGNYGLIIPELA